MGWGIRVESKVLSRESTEATVLVTQVAKQHDVSLLRHCGVTTVGAFALVFD